MLNNEQRKHLSTTLRNLGFAALIPIGLKICGAGIEFSIVLSWFLIAIWFELLALQVLKGVTDD